MGVLERKKEGTEVISVRIPTAINTKLVELRRRGPTFGVPLQCDAGGILSEGANRIREELDDEERKMGGLVRTKRQGTAW